MSPKHREAESGASEAEIERALYVGNYAGAVDICLEVSSAEACCGTVLM